MTGRKPLSRQIIRYNPDGPSISKQRFKLAYVTWLKQAKVRSGVIRMLAGAREAALRDRDALMQAIEMENHDELTNLLRKLLPASNGSAITSAHVSDAPESERNTYASMEALVQDLRVLGNQMLGKELSKEEAVEQMLRMLDQWRGILTERAVAAAADGAAKEYCKPYQGE